MHIKITVADEVYPLTVPDELLTEAQDFFAMLDRDMDRGWQMSREWVPSPNAMQRCQIIADRILTAIHKENQAMIGLACAYILKTLPGVTRVDIDASGDMTQTTFGIA